MMQRESRPGSYTEAADNPAEDHLHRNGRNGHELSGLPFRDRLKVIAAELSMRYTDLKAIGRDPFKMDTPANHRDAQWLKTQADRFIKVDKLHPRAMHYALLSAGVRKPNGDVYLNLDANVDWLEDIASVARWLGYIPWGMIRDSRNPEPVIHPHEPPQPEPYINVDLKVYLPDENDLRPRPRLANFHGTQPYRLVLIAEKESCEPVLTPIATRFKADLFIVKGDPSDTRVWQMAKTADDDGRPMRVFYLSDCDPAGYNMPGVLAHKLRYFKEAFYPSIDFDVHRVGLTPDQVREHDLPGTPLKAGEKRADDWIAAMGCEQIEVDALVQLRPELLHRIVIYALTPFYDHNLDQRVAAAKQEWMNEAQTIVDQRIGEEGYAVRDYALRQLDAIQQQVEQLTEDFHIDADDFDLPEPVIPDPQVDEFLHPLGFIDSDCTLAEHYRRALAAKRYDNGEMGDHV